MMTIQVNSHSDNTQAVAHAMTVPPLVQADTALLDRYFEQAIGHHTAGQWQQAELYYQKILELEANQPAVYYNLGMLKWQTHARESSLDCFRQALSADINNTEYWITYVDALIQTGQHAYAREALMRGLEHGLHGDEVNALVDQLSAPVIGKAVTSVELPASHAKTVSMDEVPSVSAQAVDINTAVSMSDGPKRINQRSQQNKPLKIKTYASDPKIREAFNLLQAGKLEQAKTKFKQLLKFNAAHPLIMSGLGSIALQQNQVQEGIQWLEKSLALDPNQTTALSVLSVACLEQKRFHEAEQYCDRAIALNPNYAEAYLNRGNALKALNWLEQALLSYEKFNALRPKDAEGYFYLADCLNKLKQHARAETTLKQGLKLKPNNAVMQTIYGEILLALKRFNEALSTLNQAVNLDKQYFNAYLSRGVAFLGLKRFAEAKVDFQKALSLDANSESAYLNLAVALHKQGLIAEAVAANQKVLAINPGNIQALSNQGLFLVDDLQIEQAFVAYDLALQYDASDAFTHWNKAVLQLLTGDFEQGWRTYEWRWQTILKDAVRCFPQPLWTGDLALEGKTILIYPEQGLGDYLQFCRYATVLQSHGAKVILEVPKPLKALMRSLPGNYTIIETGLPLPVFDVQCPIMSLPLAFKTNLATIPAPAAYLFADAQKLGEWTKKLGPKTKPRIGLVWSGGTAHTNDHNRSIPLNDFKQILNPAMEFHVLQKEIRESDNATLSEIGGLCSYTDQLQDFSDTAALIAQMDLVISVDTSVAHLAAAMGKPCWILLPYAPDFRWLLARHDSPWYPSARLFRQPKTNDWAAVIANVKENLTKF